MRISDWSSDVCSSDRAVASGVNITYKILYNDAVAMTGGQHFDGPLSVSMIANQVAAEGVNRVVVVTDEPDKYPTDVNFPRPEERRVGKGSVSTCRFRW